MPVLRSSPQVLRGVASVALAAASVALLLVGCGREEEIKHYTVTKPEVLEKEYFGASGRPKNDTGLDGLLGAIVTRGPQLWFFKLVGPNETVATQAASFATFIDSLSFKEGLDSSPEWKLPEGWHQEPGSGMRFATIVVDTADKKLDLSVTTFPKPAGTEEEAILLNVNRWRGQLGLEPITQSQLAEQSKTMKLSFGRAVAVYLVGHMKSGGMGGPMAGGPFSGGAAPFAGGGLPPDHPVLPADHPPISDDHGAGDQGSANHAAPAEGGAAITFDTPTGWQPEPGSAMRKAAFVVRDEKQKVEITVIALPLFAGDVLANVNRWRGQVHLDEIKADELAKLVKPISVGGTSGSYLELKGPTEPAPRLALLGVLVARPDQVWFVKLMGDAMLAEREQANFEKFVKSIKFTSP